MRDPDSRFPRKLSFAVTCRGGAGPGFVDQGGLLNLQHEEMSLLKVLKYKDFSLFPLCSLTRMWYFYFPFDAS